MSTATTATEQVQDEFSAFATGFDVDAMESRMRHGGLIPVGKYNAMLIGESRKQEQEHAELGTNRFKLTAGRSRIRKSGTRLHHRQLEKQRSPQPFGHRLGLCNGPPTAKGLVKVDGKINLAVFDTPCVIEIIHEPGDRDPNKCLRSSHSAESGSRIIPT